jgi:hypothetical protein
MLEELNKMEEEAAQLDSEANSYRRISDVLQSYFNNDLKCLADGSQRSESVFKFYVGNDRYKLGHAVEHLNESFESIMNAIGPEILKIMKFEFIKREKLCLLKAKSIRLQIFSRIIPEAGNEAK